jgi:ribonucleoside-diphosphate reductase alpha chain
VKFKNQSRFIKGRLIKKGSRPVYRINLRNNSSVLATENHKFLKWRGGTSTLVDWVELKDLKVGDKLRIHIPTESLPTYEKTELNLQDSSIGWLLGDGWIRERVVGVCFSPEKDEAKEPVVKELCKLFNYDYSSKESSIDSRSNVKSVIFCKDECLDILKKEYNILPALSKEKYLGQQILNLPASRLASILSGLFSADGCVQIPTNYNKPYAQLSSASLVLLKDVKAALSLFGIHSSITFSYLEKRDRYQGVVTIQGGELIKFEKLINFNLSTTKQNKLKEAVKLVETDKTSPRLNSEILSITLEGEEEVFDISLLEGHHFIAEGIVTHNCNLASLVLAFISQEELPNIVATATRILDNAIELTSPPTEDSARHNKRYRTIGLGSMGLADNLAANDLNYYTGKEYTAKLFEQIAFYSFKESIKLAKERGSFEAYEGSELSKGFVLGKLFYGKQYILVDELRVKLSLMKIS